MKQHNLILTAAALAASLLAGCGAGQQKSPVAVVDTDRMLQYWPKYLNYQNQFSVDMAAIDRSRASENQKNQARMQLQSKYASVQRELTDDVRSAATQVAKDQHYQLVVTHQFIGYGGTDITPQVEQILKIVETSPSPSSKP